MNRGGEPIAAKVPEVLAVFWVVKILTTVPAQIGRFLRFVNSG